jgi:hypothetical protein
MRTTALLVGAALLLGAWPGRGGEGDKPGIELEIKGTVRTGLAAIGGETTGVVIGTKEGFGCELKGVKDQSVNKKTCVVKGTYNVKEGVEIRKRAILTVSSIKVADEKPDENYVKARIVGTIKTGVVAPGGATTGTTITAAGVTWELDLSKDKEFAATAKSLDGKLAQVSGTVEVKKATAAPPRPRTIVTVTQIKAAGK